MFVFIHIQHVGKCWRAARTISGLSAPGKQTNGAHDYLRLFSVSFRLKITLLDWGGWVLLALEAEMTPIKSCRGDKIRERWTVEVPQEMQLLL